MLIFRQILYETDVTICNELIDEVFNNDLVMKYSSFSDYFEKLCRRKTEWYIAYRTCYVTRGRNTNNLVEASIRVFKDIVSKRCRAFNPVAFVEFVTNALETHQQRRIQRFASFRVAKPELGFKKFYKRANDLQSQHNLYHVNSTKEISVVYTVYTDLNICECPAGIGGAFCKHLCAVQVNYGVEISTSPSLSFQGRLF